MPASTTDLLRQVPLFQGLDEPSLELLASRSRRRRFPPHAALFHEGDPGHTLYVLITGAVNIQTVTAAGASLHLARRKAGDAFGEMALLSDLPRMADAVTAEDSELLMLDRDDFTRCVETNPRLALSVMWVLADRLREAAGHLETRQSQDVLGRVAGVLLDVTAGDGSGEPAAGARVTQAMLADLAGTTRESVNRALASLRHVGAVGSEGRRIVILDRARLRRYCGRTG